MNIRPQRSRVLEHAYRIYLSWDDTVVAPLGQQWLEKGIVYRRGCSRRPRNINMRDDCAIIRLVTSSPTTPVELFRRHYHLPCIRRDQGKLFVDD
ncbi:uncharacterized protein TNCV_593261 [Trichonephila clavipes]|nr:uncharacterized protein TNCV_593261 [Trichonephila clavipes]